MQQVRPPAVAGMFYPGDPGDLAREVAAMLADARAANAADATVDAGPPKALIVPHAGYIYSGPVAASAYAALACVRNSVHRVVLLGPTHRVAVRGLAVPRCEAFATPLGPVALDAAGIAAALTLPQVCVSDPAHALEHSLEVQLPFLQSVLDEFTLVPLAVGEATGHQVAEVLELLWGGPETLIVISSDLSHYHSYETARRLDGATADDVMHLRPLASHDQACGATPVNGLIEAARRQGLQPRLLDLRNSGDTAGDKSRVVGYAALAFTENRDG